MKVTAGRRVPTIEAIERPGDYASPQQGAAPDRPASVWFLLPVHQGTDKFDYEAPGSGLHRITAPPWDLRECPDGSLQVRPSIACGPGGEHWHGYLDAGHQWRQP